MTTSIIDYIFRELAITYLGRHDLAHVSRRTCAATHGPWRDGGRRRSSRKKRNSASAACLSEAAPTPKAFVTPRTEHLKPLQATATTRATAMAGVSRSCREDSPGPQKAMRATHARSAANLRWCARGLLQVRYLRSDQRVQLKCVEEIIDADIRIRRQRYVMEIEGVVHNGVIVPDDATALPEEPRANQPAQPRAKAFGERFAQFKELSRPAGGLGRAARPLCLGTPKR